MFHFLNNDSDELHDSVGGVDCDSIDNTTILLVLVVMVKVVLVGMHCSCRHNSISIM